MAVWEQGDFPRLREGALVGLVVRLEEARVCAASHFHFVHSVVTQVRQEEVVLQTVVDGIDGNFLELEGIFGPVVDVVQVDGAVEDRRPQPLQVEGGIGLARQVGDDGRPRGGEVCVDVDGGGGFALVALGVGFRPDFVAGVGGKFVEREVDIGAIRVDSFNRGGDIALHVIDSVAPNFAVRLRGLGPPQVYRAVVHSHHLQVFRRARNFLFVVDIAAH